MRFVILAWKKRKKNGKSKRIFTSTSLKLRKQWEMKKVKRNPKIFKKLVKWPNFRKLKRKLITHQFHFLDFQLGNSSLNFSLLSLFFFLIFFRLFSFLSFLFYYIILLFSNLIGIHDFYQFVFTDFHIFLIS